MSIKELCVRQSKLVRETKEFADELAYLSHS